MSYKCYFRVNKKSLYCEMLHSFKIITKSKPRPLLTEGKRSAGIGASVSGAASAGGASTTVVSAFTVSLGGAGSEGAELGVWHGASSGSWRPEELR